MKRHLQLQDIWITGHYNAINEKKQAHMHFGYRDSRFMIIFIELTRLTLHTGRCFRDHSYDSVCLLFVIIEINGNFFRDILRKNI